MQQVFSLSCRGSSRANSIRKTYFQMLFAICLLSLFAAMHSNHAYADLLTTQTGDNVFGVVEFPVNGVNAKFLISTGAEFSTLNSSVASSCRLSDTGTMSPPVPGFTAVASLLTGAFLFGPTEAPLEFAVADGIPLPPSVDGILGSSFLTSRNFSLGGDLLTINPDFPVTSGPKGEFIVAVTVKGEKGQQSLKFEVDTGAGPTTLTTAQANALGLKDTGRTVKLGGAASGTAPIKSGTLDDLGTANFTVTDSIAALPSGVVGVLGRDVLDKRFNWSWKEDGTGTLTITAPNGDKKSVGVVKTVTTVPVPEPSTLILGGSGLTAAMVGLKRKRLSKKV